MPSMELAPFVIGAERTQVPGDGGVSAKSFARCRALVCPQAIDPPLLATVLNICRTARFAPDPVDRLGHREIETPHLAGAALTLALSRSNLIRWIEETTECGPLGSIDGRVAQIRPAPGHGLRRHDDLKTPGGRRLGITIDLSPGLDHRVLPLTSGGLRRVCAGWFLKSAKAADRDPKGTGNSSGMAAIGESVLREFLKRKQT